MNLRPLLPLLWWAVAGGGGRALLPGALASEAVMADDGGGGDDGQYYDLESMSDEELEEICTSRGFDLVRETDPDTGEPLEYTHRDFVDAASECLQIESDLEDILQKHPELLEDVKKESERMMGERDRLLAELRKQQEQQRQQQEQQHQQGEGMDGPEEERRPRDAAAADVGEGPANPGTAAGPDARDESDDAAGVGGVPADPAATVTGSFKEITLEVIQQVKSDVATVANFLLPKSRRERIRTWTKETLLPAVGPYLAAARDKVVAAYRAACSEEVRERIKSQIRETVLPALKSFAIVAKDMGTTAYGMARRYLSAMMNAQAGGEGGVEEGDERREETATAA